MAGNRRWKRLIGLLFVLLIWGAPAVLAAVPAEINYQGSIEDLSGPVDGTLTMTFRLFDADVAGTIVWEEAQSVLVNQGIYNVILGTGTLNPSYGSLEEAVFGNDSLWLEIQVAGEADAMAPRQKITSVGFAMRAGSVSDNAITAAMLAHDAVTTDKLFDGAVTAAKVTGGFVPNLDADLLDGLSATAFSTAGHTHDTRYYTQAHVDSLETRIAALEAKLQYLTLVAGTVNGMPGPHMMITGANLHLRSGSGGTSGAVNGLGNLVVGYNEVRGSGDDRNGSHNLVVGSRQNYSSFGGLLAGYYNTLSGSYASVSGGGGNTASGNQASVTGGASNIAGGNNASISGGSYNKASGRASFVGGGGSGNSVDGNEAFGDYSAILGGYKNFTGDQNMSDHSVGQNATISGGGFNRASGRAAFVGGGGGDDAILANTAFGNFTAILGGSVNLAGDPDLVDHDVGNNASVSGGENNTASGRAASVSGGARNSAIDWAASVSGGQHNTASDYAASVSGGERNTASGGFASVSGGANNTANDTWVSVSGGGYNTASYLFASVSGGIANTASGYAASVSGGKYNKASGEYSFVGGGGHALAEYGNEAFSNYSAVLGGAYNIAGDDSDPDNHSVGELATIAGGDTNRAKGGWSSIAGGRGNIANNNHTTVSGGDGNTASNAFDSVVGDVGRVYVDSTPVH